MSSLRFLSLLFLFGMKACSSVKGAESPPSLLDQSVSSPELRRTLTTEYESSTNNFSGDRLLAVAIGYAVESNYHRAKPIYEQFLHDHPDHPRALRGIGTICALQGRYGEAAGYLKKAWSLGDVGSLQPLAVVCIKGEKDDEVETLLPALLKHKSEDIGIAHCLVGYAIAKEPPRFELLLEAIDSMPDKEFVLRDDSLLLVRKAIARIQEIDSESPLLGPILRKIVRGYQADTNSWPRERFGILGDAHRLLNDFATAENLYFEMLKDHQNDPTVLRGLGVL
jgi:hypothetical protein